MVTLVIGGANSGKSAYAEQLAVHLAGSGRMLYLATMESVTAEATERITKHRRAREGKGFLTVECPRALDRCTLPDSGVILLEDLGNLCANEMFSGDGTDGDVYEAVLTGFRHVARTCQHLVIVSNETALGGTDYDAETMRYLETMGRLHCVLAHESDHVCEVVCGIPVFHKGKGPV